MSAVRQLSGLGAIRRISARDADGLQACSQAHARTVAGLELVYSALAVALSGEGHRGYGNSSDTITITVPLVTATPQGGSSPITYAWARTDGGAGSWTITSPTGAETAFQIDLGPGESGSAEFACTVTDASGAEAVSETWPVTAINLGGAL